MRVLWGILIAIVAAAVLIAAIGCFALSAPRYRGPVTDHFDGRRFHNIPPVEHRGFFEFLRWRLEREPAPWTTIENPPGPPPPRRVEGEGLRVTFVSHATVLIQMEGANILVDPIWSERASPLPWLGPRRHESPGIRFEDLPPIDAVVITHNHYDHMDLPTLRRLAAAFRPRIYAGLGNGTFLASRGIGGAQELDWWQGATLSPHLSIVAVPARHFSARGLCDRDRTLWASYVIEGRHGAVYVAGDTGFGKHFEAIRDRLGPLRLAILPIGAFTPRWFMAAVHLSPAEAVEAFRLLGARQAMAVHFGAFALGDDRREEPAAVLRDALEEAAIPPERFLLPSPGVGVDIPY